MGIEIIEKFDEESCKGDCKGCNEYPCAFAWKKCRRKGECRECVFRETIPEGECVGCKGTVEHPHFKCRPCSTSIFRHRILEHPLGIDHIGGFPVRLEAKCPKCDEWTFINLFYEEWDTIPTLDEPYEQNFFCKRCNAYFKLLLKISMKVELF